MDDVLTRIWTDLIGRLTGPLTLRLYLQPAMAMIFAVRDGVRDARAGRPPYLWRVFTHPEERRALIRDEWKAIGKVFILAIVLDLVYQFVVFRWVYPVETLDVAIILAVLPYSLLRGPINRLARFWIRHDVAPPTQPTRSRP
jgi:hypothetical protein